MFAEFKDTYGEFYDIEGQKERAKLINKLFIEQQMCDMDENGLLGGPEGRTKWRGGSAGGLDLWFFLCQGLWQEGGQYGEMADKVSATFVELKEYDTFFPFLCALALVRNMDSLTENLKNKFENYIKNNIDYYMSDNEDFIGVNDNTPILMVAGLALAGEYFSNDVWLKKAEERLLRLKAMTKRRGYFSEYNSLTYTPVSAFGLASIVNYVKNPKIRELALQSEIFLWDRLLNLYMPSVTQSAPPYARSYYDDKRCHTRFMRPLLYAVLGDECGLSPINTVFSEDRNEKYVQQVCCTMIANMIYHCPTELVEKIKMRKYPYIVRGTAETSASADTFQLPILGGVLSAETLLRNDLDALGEQDEIYEYAAGVINTYTYMDKTYSLGTASYDWHNGVQTDSFALMYADREKATEQSQAGSIYAEYSVNDSPYYLEDMGRKVAFQGERSAMVLYHPKWCGEKVKEAALNVIFANASHISEIRLGNDVITDKGITEQGAIFKDESLSPIYIHTANLYVMILPLMAEKDRKDAVMEMSTFEDNAKISIYNYKGEERIFHKKGFCAMTNGFAFEVRREDEFKDFSDFIEHMKNFTVTEKIRTNIHTRYAIEREVCYSGADKELTCCISLLTDGIKYMTVDGEVLEEVKYEVKNLL